MAGADTITIGVTGHRVLPDAASLVDPVDRALDELSGGAVVHLLTSLAEGADRLVARRVLVRAGGTITAVLPLEPEEYERDFADRASCDDFRALLAEATEEEVVEVERGAGRTAAYEAAGVAVVERSDALLALWDGEPARGRGGTAEIVEHARAIGRPVVVVEVQR